ncbi:MAG: hypothetical protein ACC656_08570 [Candidatus Heimdallarchaeota archaeon]
MLSSGQKVIVKKYMETWKRGMIAKLDEGRSPNPSTLTGQSSKEIVYVVNNNGAVLYGPSYVSNLEFGRRPGKMPPVAPLIEWARLRGFEDPESAGWAIAINISKEGTLLFQSGKSSGILSDVITPKSVDELAEELAEVTLLEVSTLIFSKLIE